MGTLQDQVSGPEVISAPVPRKHIQQRTAQGPQVFELRRCKPQRLVWSRTFCVRGQGRNEECERVLFSHTAKQRTAPVDPNNLHPIPPPAHQESEEESQADQGDCDGTSDDAVTSENDADQHVQLTLSQ